MIHTSMFQKHIHKVKFYPSADDFTQALLVMLVTNITAVLAVQIQRQSNANLGQIGLMWIQDQLAAQLAPPIYYTIGSIC